MWHLIVDTGHVFVEHMPNAPSGGRSSRIPVGTFLARGDTPEQAALLRLIGTLCTDETPSAAPTRIG